MTEEEIEFWERWNIAGAYDPSKSYEDLVKEEGEGTILLGFFDPQTPVKALRRDVDVQAAFGTKMSKKDKIIYKVLTPYIQDGKIMVEIDLNCSNSRLNEGFKKLIRDQKHRYENALRRYFCRKHKISFPPDSKNEKKFQKFYAEEKRKRGKVYDRKLHYDDFDGYLKVYDLHQQGKSWSQIHRALKLNSVQTARNHHNSALARIEKGIDSYVK